MDIVAAISLIFGGVAAAYLGVTLHSDYFNYAYFMFAMAFTLLVLGADDVGD